MSLGPSEDIRPTTISQSFIGNAKTLLKSAARIDILAFSFYCMALIGGLAILFGAKPYWAFYAILACLGLSYAAREAVNRYYRCPVCSGDAHSIRESQKTDNKSPQ